MINRGWIPYELKDRKSRISQEGTTKHLTKVYGVFRPGKDIHDYKIPNDPDNGEWHNLALEDIAMYFKMINKNECK